MTSREFCYWLQGYFEIGFTGCENPKIDRGITSDRVKVIERHLALVFKHEIDPSYGPPEKQAKLNQVHSPDAFVVATSQNPLDHLVRC